MSNIGTFDDLHHEPLPGMPIEDLTDIIVRHARAIYLGAQRRLETHESEDACKDRALNILSSIIMDAANSMVGMYTRQMAGEYVDEEAENAEE